MSYANVVATMALFLALGGVGYAATKLPKNSVGTKQLKNGAVTASKINRSTKASLAGTGPVGPAGPAGPAGEPGSARAYARVNTEGELVPGHSKGVIDVVPACFKTPESACGARPEFINSEYCFKLNFEPNVVLVTPVTGVVYNHETPPADAEVPGRTYTELRGGCPVEYRSASVRIARPSSFEPTFGFFVLFN